MGEEKKSPESNWQIDGEETVHEKEGEQSRGINLAAEVRQGESMDMCATETEGKREGAAIPGHRGGESVCVYV